MNERRSKMIEIIKQEREVSFGQLKKYFPNVSEMTLRRDLEELDRSRQIIRVHGGAKSVDSVVGFSEDLYANRSIENVESKMQIANKALNLIRQNEAIFLDSGSTVTAFSKILPDDHYKIVTSGLTCAIELSRMSVASVFMLGGQIYNNSLSVNGTQSTRLLGDINFDTVFIGTTGYIKGEGFNVNVEEDYELKKLVISRAKKIVILMDTSKLGKSATYTFARLEDIDVVVTDENISSDVINEFIEKGIEVI